MAEDTEDSDNVLQSSDSVPIIAKVPHFMVIFDNEYNDDIENAKSTMTEDVPPCECRFIEGGITDEMACGPASSCINRTLFFECDPHDCPARRYCQNQRFQKQEYADVEIFETAGKGFGLRTIKDLRKYKVMRTH